MGWKPVPLPSSKCTGASVPETVVGSLPTTLHSPWAVSLPNISQFVWFPLGRFTGLPWHKSKAYAWPRTIGGGLTANLKLEGASIAGAAVVCATAVEVIAEIPTISARIAIAVLVTHAPTNSTMLGQTFATFLFGI
jgi:hypothetical protein